MEHVRNRQAEKRLDLARSTCSPLGSVAREARKAKVGGEVLCRVF